MTNVEQHLDGARLLRRCKRTVWCGRVMGWLMTLTLAGMATFLFAKKGHIEKLSENWGLYVATLAAVLVWYHVVPFVLMGWTARAKVRVSASGDKWTIGKYSEQAVRQVLNDATARLFPIVRHPIRVVIDDQRGSEAWTWPSLLWFGWPRRFTIRLSSGMLHYMDPDELTAVLLHEIGHHIPENKTVPYSVFVLNDVLLHAITFWIYLFLLPHDTVIFAFWILHLFWALLFSLFQRPADQGIEHLCDLFSARHSSMTAAINALLKLGEEEELTEAVLVLAARELVHRRQLDMDDLILAFLEVRPYGRIFHESVFHHAAEIVKRLSPHEPAVPPKRSAPRSGRTTDRRPKKTNPELESFIANRKARRMPRIRWRRFDGRGAGRLTEEEIGWLCAALEARPDHVLVSSQHEQYPTSHPPMRTRVLFLYRWEQTGNEKQETRNGAR